jgi:hypothetical protein
LRRALDEVVDFQSISGQVVFCRGSKYVYGSDTKLVARGEPLHKANVLNVKPFGCGGHEPLQGL